MAINRFLEREHEMAAQAEASYGVDPGACVAGDFFKHQTGSDAVEAGMPARYDRDQDADYDQASVLSTQLGRKSSKVKIEGDVVPSGNGTTPAEPDMDLLYKNNLGTSHKGTAHTTTVAGSTGVTLKLATGGWVASGMSDGDLFGVNVDANNGIEVRQAVSHTGDDVTMERALSANPAAGRDVIPGVTYKLDRTALGSLTLKRFLGGSALRYKVTGLILPDMEITYDSTPEVPKVRVVFSGQAKAEVPHTDTRPTPTTAGDSLCPTKSKVWFDAGATPKAFCICGVGSLKINNGRDLRMSESDSLEPTGVKLTGNNARYMIQMALGMLLSTGDRDVSAVWAAILVGTYQDVLVQHGDIAGKILAWRCPRWLPDLKRATRDGEMGITLDGGRCYGTSNDDEVRVAFI